MVQKKGMQQGHTWFHSVCHEYAIQRKKKQAMMREKIDQKVIFVIFSSASAQIDGTLHETKQNPRVHLQSTN